MSRSTQHSLLPETNQAGLSRRLATLACKRAIRGKLETALRADFEREFPSHEDHPPPAERVDDALVTSQSYRLWSSASRASQDRMWQVLAEQVDADYERIASAASAATLGKLTLNPEAVPSYQWQHCIHGQPGGYMLERHESDLAAGVLYEAGGNLYALGQGIGKRDSKGERLIQHIKERCGDIQPRRILEVGCAAGGQTADYALGFPHAECHAIDLSPGMLRYARARSALLGADVSFSQADAAATPFPDGHFDLIVSHNLFHEAPAEHVERILAECFRLLAPGGYCFHQDVPTQVDRLDPFTRFLSSWQKDNNDEPYWLEYANADLPQACANAGFDAERIHANYLRALDGPIPWYVIETSKPR